jgi:hypothetical protein
MSGLGRLIYMPKRSARPAVFKLGSAASSAIEPAGDGHAVARVCLAARKFGDRRGEMYDLYDPFPTLDNEKKEKGGEAKSKTKQCAE